MPQSRATRIVCLFFWQLNYDGHDDDDDDDDDQLSSVYSFSIKVYKKRSSKHLKGNGKVAHGNHEAYKEKGPPR